MAFYQRKCRFLAYKELGRFSSNPAARIPCMFMITQYFFKCKAFQKNLKQMKSSGITGNISNIRL